MDARVIKKSEVESRLNAALAEGKAGVSMIGKDDGLGYGVVIAHLTDRAPKPESHDNADDVYHVIDGEGTIYLGGTIDGRQETSPGEWIGESLTGATETVMRAGDIVSIPRTVPHMVGCPGGSVRYLVVKVY